MNHCHLRVTPPTEIYDLSQVIINATKYCIYSEIGEETKKQHFHIYMETEKCESTIKNDLRRGFNIPLGKKGINSAYFCCKFNKYKDPSPEYVAKSGILVSHKGYTLSYLQEIQISGNNKFLEKTEVTKNEPDKKKEKGEWEILLNDFEKVSDNKNYSMSRIIKWIKSRYLMRRKCIPRTGDIHRYSYSLYAIINNLQKEEDIHEIDSRYQNEFGNNI